MARPLTSPWGGDSSEDETDESRLLNGTNRNYQSTQQQYIREHTEGLDRLGEAIKRQKQMANEIGNEVEIHNEILDNIDDGLTNTDSNIRKNTRNIRLVMKKSSTFYLWLMIVILAFVIGGLAIF